MILISHRGNINGSIPDMENRPEYILDTIKAGYDCEIDIWWSFNGWFLGHDQPQYAVKDDFFKKADPYKTWYHAKNGEAFYKMLQNPQIHCFWHEKDQYVLTSRGYVWVYPKIEVLKDSICVMPEEGVTGNLKLCAGICSDTVAAFKSL